MKIEVKKDFLEIDGKPVFLFGGDLSYCRIPRRSWKDRMLRMKEAGLNTVTVYAVWCRHETEPGKFNFSGECDLGAFLDLIGECGMYCVFRMGPFVHGEYRNGGLPQWLVNRLGSRVRTNDPEYLKYAERWYGELLRIGKPRLCGNGGPVILIQLENELGSAGCKGDDLARGSSSSDENTRHLLFYYNLVREHGFDLPVIDINHIPDKDRLFSPLVDSAGSYPVNCFCCDGDLTDFSTKWWDSHQRPLVTVETGGGMFVRYYDTPAYRNTNGFQGPLVKSEIVEATVQKHLAEGCSGVNLYIFCDGVNPDGCGESMLPKSMNYQAPLSVAGRMRPSYFAMKRIGWFLRSFGAELLGASPDPDWAKVRAFGIPHPGAADGGDLFENYGKVRPAGESVSAERPPAETDIPALARVTTGLNLGEPNFLFLRNAFNVRSLWRRNVRVLVSPSRLACEVWQEYPRKTQLDMPPGTLKTMPFFLRLRPRHFLEYSTAELFDRRPFAGKTQVILCESPEVMTETRLVLPSVENIRSSEGVLVLRESPNTETLIAKPGRLPLTVETPELRIVLVSREYAEHIWDAGTECAFSSAELSGPRSALLCRTETKEFLMELLTPDPPRFESGLNSFTETFDPALGQYRLSGTFDLPECKIHFAREFRGGDLVLTGRLPVIPEDADDVILTLSFEGSVGEARVNGHLVSDHAYGRFLPWELSVRDSGTPGDPLEILCRDTSDCRVSVSVQASRILRFR